MTDPTDEDLLVASVSDEEAFAQLYRRHCAAVAGFFLHRVREPELAADLTAETFAAALAGRRRYRPDKGPATAWLYGIARHKLTRAYERGRVEDKARRALGMARLELDDEAIERIVARTSLDDTRARLVDSLAALPDEQREAVQARVVDERSYGEIAQAVACSESVIRKRVSRGLAGLRAQLEEPT